MDDEEAAQLRYQEMCRIVGDVVFAMIAEGHETRRVAIADVIRTEISKGIDKWDLDQIQVMELAVKLLCKHTRFSSTHFLRFPDFQPSAGTLPASGCSGIHGDVHCCIHSASAPLFPVLHSVF